MHLLQIFDLVLRFFYSLLIIFYFSTSIINLYVSNYLEAMMFGMRNRIFIVEQFIHTLLVVRVFATHLISTQLYLAIILFLLVAQHFKEGHTPKLLLFLPILFLQVYSQLNQYIQLQYIAAILGSLLHFWPLKFYWLPEPEKIVGYRQDSLQNGLHYMEFYPLDAAQSITEKPIKWNSHNQLTKILQYAISNNLLKKLAYFLISFADKLHIKVGEGVEKKTQSSIAFCHGRGATPLLYSSYLTFMAGLGYRVGAVQHSQVNSTKLQKKHQIKQYRMKEVQVRAAEFYQTIQKVQNDNIVLVGHSYGCATIIHTYHSLEDELRKKVMRIILLDPWFFPLNEKVIKECISCPILILANQDFIKNPDMYQSNKHFLEHHKADKVEYILWKNAHHAHQTDMGFVLGNLPTVCKHSHMSDILYRLNQQAIQKFLKDEKVEGTFGQKDLGRNFKPQKFYHQDKFPC